jgi:PAS domain S-box-containing protein
MSEQAETAKQDGAGLLGRLLTPGVRLMTRLSYARKFTLISLLFLLPLGFAVGGALFELADRIAFSEAEVDGNRALRPLCRLLEVAIAAEGDPRENEARLTAALDAVASADAAGPRRYLDARLVELRGLAGRAGAAAAHEVRERLRAAVIEAVNHVGDQSNLILDPDLDTYYLMDAVVLRLPEAQSLLADVLSMARAHDPTSEERRVLAAQLAGRLAAARDTLERGTRVATRNSREGLDAARTSVPLAVLTMRVEAVLRGLGRGGQTAQAATAAQLSADAQAALGAAFSLWDANVAELGRLLDLRIGHLRARRALGLVATSVSLLLVAYLWMAFYRSVRRTVQALTEAPSRLSEGRFDAVTIPARDELGQVVLSFNAVGAQLRAEWELAREEETKAKAAEVRARREEERVRRLLESSLDGIVMFDGEGRVTEWNPQAAALFGWPRQEALCRPVTTLIERVGRGDAELRHPLLRAVHGDAAILNQRTEMRARRKGGTEFPLELAVTRIETTSEVAYAAFIRDLTERNQLEVQLRQTQKLESIGQLAAGIAHEINTPVQYISDNLTFLRGAFADLNALVADYRGVVAAAEGSAEPGTIAERIVKVRAAEADRDLEFLEQNVPGSLDMALEGAQRVSQIVRAMKEFSHPGATEKTPTDLNRAIETTLTVARNEWKYVADAVTRLDPDLPAIPCLPGEINQVLLNLIVNAAHAISDVVRDQPGQKGTITVVTRLDGAFAEIQIADSGAGIPEHVKARMFEPFFTTKAVGRGTGQGLTIARNVIVKKHGGTIAFDSEVGRGTTFTIRLPVEPPQSQQIPGSVRIAAA